mmetsp:Transcript_31378/g.44530  ORF Transcript_31378/g.44530 Transcript_31378/m.44530 type:complete len:103 (-) Transcript_31378:121-429(-)|eukprot:CAMPEP_0202444556 /NCGR_PEP_ID=MMETSP1360-20130828/3585_1 /ASSEMBLY_ACC=CAM_ASM_000848 /TAXON_ID=515479 /ORGANISM="Licmophora paradoxa, Strain CCMP2313" /LENGTH=102 /DNA_ID=CAMNT_0049060575 /DNA_START=68 /DNA_END=376 /DNA_ORIENTATION=-
MIARFLLLLLIVLVSTEAFAPSPAFGLTRQSTKTSLFACRTNAKKEKIKRNRENMRKFKTNTKRGLSRRKTMKKAQASKARQEEADFISQCFSIFSTPSEEE